MLRIQQSKIGLVLAVSGTLVFLTMMYIRKDQTFILSFFLGRPELFDLIDQFQCDALFNGSVHKEHLIKTKNWMYNERDLLRELENSND